MADGGLTELYRLRIADRQFDLPAIRAAADRMPSAVPGRLVEADLVTEAAETVLLTQSPSAPGGSDVSCAVSR